MRFFAVAAAALIAAVSAENFTVIVGENGGLTYNPTSLIAQVGDTIAFQFVAKNHTVTQSTFATPCERLATGIDSGFQSVNSTTQFPQWSFTLTNASAPMWFYCAQKPHCEKGMVFALNPTAAKTFDAFHAAALATAANTTTTSASSGTSGTASAAATSASSTNKAASGGSSLTGNTAALLAAVGILSLIL